MIYMEPTSLGFAPLLDSWLQSLPAVVAPAAPQLRDIFDALIPGLDGALLFLRRSLKEVVPTVDTSLVASLFNVMDRRAAAASGPVRVTCDCFCARWQCSLR